MTRVISGDDNQPVHTVSYDLFLKFLDPRESVVKCFLVFTSRLCCHKETVLQF